MKNFITISFCLLLVNLSFSQNFSLGLIACYPFTGNALDSSSNHNDGVVSGATLTAGEAGIPNTAYYFNGVNNYIHVQHSLSLDTPTVLTMCAVVKPMGFWTGPCQGNVIFYKGPDRTPGHYGMDFSDNNCDGESCSLVDTSLDDFRMEVGTIWDYTTPCYSPNIVPNTWYCIICTYDGDSLRFYIDGQFKYSSAVAAFGTNDSGLYMGWNPFPPAVGTFNYWYHGVIDDLRIYDRVMGPEQLKDYCDFVSGIKAAHDIENAFAVFPNPSAGEIKISFGNEFNYDNAFLKIIDVSGRDVFDKKVTSHSETINCSLSKGIYFVQLQIKEGITTKKIVIE